MKQLGVMQVDLRLKGFEDLKGMFNDNIPDERKALDKLVESNVKAHELLVNKIKQKRQVIVQKASKQLLSKESKEILEKEKRNKKFEEDRKKSKQEDLTEKKGKEEQNEEDQVQGNSPKQRSRKKTPVKDMRTEVEKELDAQKNNDLSLKQLVNAKTKRIEYLKNISKDRHDFQKEKQKRDLEVMLGYEINSHVGACNSENQEEEQRADEGEDREPPPGPAREAPEAQ